MPWFYVFKGDANALYSPEFRRQGLAALFACIIYQVLNTPTLTITIEGRNDDTTTWSTMGTFAAISTVGNKFVDVTGLHENLRIKLEVAGASAVAGVAIQLLGPQWRQYA